MVVFDGGGDRPRGGVTPLHVARKPALDSLTGRGSCGLMDPISPGVRPGSDTSHLAILGYDPYRYYTGRGAFEAIGAGLELRPGDAAFRTNLATVDDRGVVVDRRAGRYVRPEEARAVEELINGPIADEVRQRLGIDVIYRSTVEHRGVLVLRGAVSSRVSDTDPHRTGEPILPAKPLEDTEEARRTAEAINLVTRLFTEKARGLGINSGRSPPINALLIRGGGHMPMIEPIYEKYNVRGFAIAGVAVIRGIARAVGMEVAGDVEGLRGTKFDSFEAAMDLAVEALARYDLVFLHVKGTDSASHDGDWDGKVSVIERFDSALRRRLDELWDHYVVVTSDHATPVAVREHTGEPVPIMVYGPDVVRDDVGLLSELTCWRGALGRVRGIDVMPVIASLMVKSEKFGE